MYEEFSSLMGKEFEMSMMGELAFFLALQIKQSSNGISICQEKYIKELLKKFNMFDSKPIDTPMGTNSKLVVEESDPLVNQTMYRGIIGSLLYLTPSRPDIVYSVGMCARFQACHRDSHLKAAKRILRYLKKIGDLVLFYPAADTFDLVILQMLILQVIKLTGRVPLEWLFSFDHHLSCGVPRSRTLWLFQLLKLNM